MTNFFLIGGVGFFAWGALKALSDSVAERVRLRGKLKLGEEIVVMLLICSAALAVGRTAPVILLGMLPLFFIKPDSRAGDRALLLSLKELSGNNPERYDLSRKIAGLSGISPKKRGLSPREEEICYRYSRPNYQVGIALVLLVLSVIMPVLLSTYV